MTRELLLLTLLFGGATACKRTAGGAARTTAAAAAVAPANARAGTSTRPPLVYIDGEARASFTYNELPSTVRLVADASAPRALLCDYFRELGADCAAIRWARFYSGSRVTIVSGAELRAVAHRLTFRFRHDLAGRPALDRDSASTLPRLAATDEISDVALCLEAHPPQAGATPRGLVGATREDDGAPPAVCSGRHDVAARGVRLDVDGRLMAPLVYPALAGKVEPVREPAAGAQARYRLVDVLAARALPIEHIRGIDLLVDDERVVRLSADELVGGVELTASTQRPDEMMFFFGDRSVTAVAVLLWSTGDPPARPMRLVGSRTVAAGGSLHAALLQPERAR